MEDGFFCYEDEYSASDYDRDRDDDRLNAWDDDPDWEEDHRAA